jgi:hypothetical protein
MQERPLILAMLDCPVILKTKPRGSPRGCFTFCVQKLRQ